MKRIFDILFAIVVFLLGLPLSIFIGAGILLTSQGPILFKQRRIGRHCKEFCIYKFRTMSHNAPMDIPTHLLDSPSDYITPVGRFLRKTSLDELPQVINILKGDMSFVGPRPALFNQYDLIELRNKFKINHIRPGLTGWAQINGRDELPIPKKVEYDKYYLLNMSLIFDMKIIFVTLFNTLLRKGIVEGKNR